MTSDGSEEPELFEGQLDSDGVESFFRDLEELAQIERILIRWADPDRASEVAVTLADSREAVRRGTVHAIQIRYRYDGEAWCDTLLADANGHRILRVRS